MSCRQHDPFTICGCCGARGQYCFEEPLGRKDEGCLERVLEWIETVPGQNVFTTTQVWHGSCYHYGMTGRVLKWLQYLGLIERMPGPPQAGNRWRVREARGNG